MQKYIGIAGIIRTKQKKDLDAGYTMTLTPKQEMIYKSKERVLIIEASKMNVNVPSLYRLVHMRHYSMAFKVSITIHYALFNITY